MIHSLRRSASALSILVALWTAGGLATATTHADGDINTLIPNNKRLNNGVVNNVYTIQHQAGCTNGLKINPQLQLAAQRHTVDVLNNRNLDGDIGSDGSTPQSRAQGAGFAGTVAETVAINSAMAISGIEILNQWYSNPASLAIMQDCANSQIGVWSENSPDRSVVVAVYGRPQHPVDTTDHGTGIDPVLDYDVSDELEFTNNWFAWILRGVYPPPGYPPQ